MVNRPLCVCPTDTWRSVPPEWLHSGSDSLPRTHKDSLLQLVHASGKVKHTLQHLGIMYFDLNIQKIVSGMGGWGGGDATLIFSLTPWLCFLSSKAFNLVPAWSKAPLLSETDSQLPQVTPQGFIQPHARLFLSALMG